MILVSESELRTILTILDKHLHSGRVLAFGSRVSAVCKPYSDLDLAIDADHCLSISELGNIREDFQESTLPYRIDVLDYNAISPEFRAVIAASNIIVWEK